VIKHCTLTICTVVAMACAAAAAAVDPELVRQADAFEKRWADQYLKYDDAKEIARLDEAADAVLATLGDDGRFSDLEYGPIVGKGGGKGWGDHLLRTVDLFTAWRLPGTKLHGDATLARKAGLALDTYLAVPYDHRDKWGYGHPYSDLLENNRIGRIALFARHDPATFPQQTVERWANAITERADRTMDGGIFRTSSDPAEQFTRVNDGWEGGANVMWATRGYLVPHLVGTDQELRIRALDRYLGHVWGSQYERSPKGPLGQIHRLTVDGMLGEHDVPAMASYGEWYLNAIIEYRELIQGVERWQMPADLNAHWIDVLLDAVAHCYQGAVDPNLGNPLIWLNPRRGENAKLKEWLRAFSAGSDHRAAEVQAVLEWNPGVTPWPFPDRSVKHFYTTDFMTKHFPRFMVSVRAISERTFGVEAFAQRGLENRWAVESVMLPLGTVLLRRDTREFQDTGTGGVFTAMDFARLPGQTTRHVSSEQLASAWNQTNDGEYVRLVTGATPFSGGVTTTRTGVMGWWQSRYVAVDRDRPGAKMTDLSVNGRRATFLLEDAIVHLGTGFALEHPEPTLTSVEQRASGPDTVTYAVGDAIRTAGRGEVVRNPNVAWVWYDGVGYLPPTHGEKVIQDVMQPGKPQKQVFSIWSDHGNAERSLSFEWAVLPDVTVERMPMLASNKPWRVIANGHHLQAIEVPDRQWAGAVFHSGGAIKALGTEIAVDRPCVLIAERVGSAVTLSLADPLGTDDAITVRLGAESKTIRFPGHPHRGSPVTTTVPIP
jgi:hypothetical protein